MRVLGNVPESLMGKTLQRKLMGKWRQLLLPCSLVDVARIVTDNLATDNFMPAAQRSALNAAKNWMAQEWPRRFRLKPLSGGHFLAPHTSLSGSENNTSNAVHKREKHGMVLHSDSAAI